DQDLTARQPRSGVHDEIANGPGPIVEIQILNAPDVAVHRLDRDALEIARCPEHVALLPEVSRPRGRRCLACATGRYFTRAGTHSCSCLRSSSCESNFLPHCAHLNSSIVISPCYFSFGTGPLSFSASSTVTLSPFFTCWSAELGKCKSIRPSGVLTSSRPLSGVTLVTSPVIVWRPTVAASAAP